MSELHGKCYVVFGAGSGLGRATAEMLVHRGAKVCVADLQREAMGATAQALAPSCMAQACDVTSPAQVGDALAKARAWAGRLDGVVNTAGIAHGERVLSKHGPHATEAFERVVRVNLLGAFNVLVEAASVLAREEPGPEGERGVIVNTASIAAFDGQGGQVAYAASKAGVVGMTLPAARDLARHGIRVVSIAPGLFLTPMVSGLPAPVKDSLEQLVPFPSRAGRPEEYADLVCHVLGNLMVNGETIRLDGALRMPA